MATTATAGSSTGTNSKKKSKKKAVELTVEQLEEEILKMKLKEQALREHVVKRRQSVAAARAQEYELRESYRLLAEAFQAAKTERFDIISDFTRQHKATEEELITRCTVLDNTITDLQDQQELSRFAVAETEKERNHIILAKEKELEEQMAKLTEMQEGFRLMLAETQAKMRESLRHHTMSSSST